MWIISAQIDRRGNSTDASDLMSIHKRPTGSVSSSSPPLDEPKPGNDKRVVFPSMAQLVPPILLDDLVLVNLVNGPKMAVTLLVQENCLKDVLRVWQCWAELPLVIAAIKAEVQLAAVLVLRLDEIHGLELLLCELNAGLLRYAGKRCDRL
jgi:hypothetical protein